MALELAEPLKGLVGAKGAKALAERFGLRTAGDLLRHYPRRYVTRGELTDLGSLHVDDHVTVLAKVARFTDHPMRQRPGTRIEVIVTDGTGELSLTFFARKQHLVAWHASRLKPGRTGLFAGKVSVYRGKRQLTHPEYQILPGDIGGEDAAKVFANEVMPVYPATKDINSWNIAKAVGILLDQLGEVPDPIPPSIKRRLGLMDAEVALRAIHQPGDLDDVRRAQHRLRFEEAFVLQVELVRRRASIEAFPAVARPGRPDGLLGRFDARLPFELTKAQREAGEQVATELACTHPMHRLLQGEVGSGKTVVALRAMLQVVDSGGQAALLAPTEVLAHQHFRTLTALLGPLAEAGMLGGSDEATRLVMLTGSMGTAARREALLAAASGEAGIVVGTHALLEEHVQFADLAFVVVDEQHRFGVEQRSALSAKGPGLTKPHVLVMTATPIPRTVAMTVFGDLWVSTMSELPAGRAEVTTHVVSIDEQPHYLDRAWERVREEVKAGHQVYIVCPRIGGDDDAPNGGTPGGSASDDGRDGSSRPTAVLDVAEMLRAGPLADLPIGMLHGRMPPDEKDDAMRRFASGEVPVLVATTVIEVGVDVSTASMMVVMDAARFGVSQLHQLRGRIGRGSAPGLCLLLTEADPDSDARRRLDAVAETRDGFKLAQVDLQQRREGDVLGAAQSGYKSSLRLLRVLRDENLIMLARDEAASVVLHDPALRRHPALAEAVAALAEADHADYLDKA